MTWRWGLGWGCACMGTDSKKDRSLRGLSERFVQLFFAEKVSLGWGAGGWGKYSENVQSAYNHNVKSTSIKNSVPAQGVKTKAAGSMFVCHGLNEVTEGVECVRSTRGG